MLIIFIFAFVCVCMFACMWTRVGGMHLGVHACTGPRLCHDSSLIVLITYYLITWGRVSQSNMELADVARPGSALLRQELHCALLTALVSSVNLGERGLKPRLTEVSCSSQLCLNHQEIYTLRLRRIIQVRCSVTRTRHTWQKHIFP